MTKQSDQRKRLARLLSEAAVEEGENPTLLEGVSITRRSSPTSRIPVVYEPKIIIVGQGRKRCYLGDKVYQYDPFNYLVMTVPMPAECEWDASGDEPLLVVAINVDAAMLGEMLLEMDEPLAPATATPRGISITPMDDELSGAVVRLLECLRKPLDARMLGPQTVREIVYRVLLGEQGGALRALASRDEHFARIARVLKSIHTDCAKPFSVEEMARQARMSVAAFHHNFKLVTAYSPLQYLKRIRLDRARRLMMHDGFNAGTAARAVGYESLSQFCREFKRLFGMTPIEGTERTRARVIAD